MPRSRKMLFVRFPFELLHLLLRKSGCLSVLVCHTAPPQWNDRQQCNLQKSHAPVQHSRGPRLRKNSQTSWDQHCSKTERSKQANRICCLHRLSNIIQSGIHGLVATATSLRLRLGRSDRQAPWLERPQYKMGMVRIFQLGFSTISACLFPSSLSTHQKLFRLQQSQHPDHPNCSTDSCTCPKQDP